MRESTAGFLREEAQAMLTRLDRIRSFALHETMVQAASLSPEAMAGVDRMLADGRRTLRRDIEGFIAWVSGPGRSASPASQQQRFVVIRLRFNDILSRFDLFAEVITQRSERENGVWLAGLDALAQDALRSPGVVPDPPALACYLARGPGAAIRRAKTRLPGGVSNPVAIVRIPRERMIGHGVGSSLVHEAGHQGAALLDLVASLRPDLQAARLAARGPDRDAWGDWERWISEIVADLWSVSRLGISSTLGLLAVVSLPRYFVFRPNVDDPHPTPYVRLRLSAAIGEALYPDPQWRSLDRGWQSLYPTDRLSTAQQQRLAAQDRTMRPFVDLVLRHRPARLGGRSIGDALRAPDRGRVALQQLAGQWGRDPALLHRLAPTLAVAVIGQARADRRLSARAEARALESLLNHWALSTTLERTHASGDVRVAATPLPAPRRPAAVA